MKEQWEKECTQLRAELAALQQQLFVLQTAQTRAQDSGQNRPRWRLSKRIIVIILPLVALVTAGGVLYGQGAMDALFIDKDGKVGVGTSTPSATLDVGGQANTDKQVSLQLRSGNNADHSESNQITLGWSGSDTYRHAIKTRHHGGQQKGNAIDFYVWKYDKDKVDKTAIGGLHTMTLNGGDVGIGTTDPKERLEVNGVVQAEGFRTAAGVSFQNALVPVGTIMAYGGDTTNPEIVKQLSAQGWLPCNGNVIKREEYSELFKMIGTAFGAGDTKTTFQVPDLRGRFLRGTDQGQGRDPDAANRRAEPAGGNNGDKVGSVQDDEFKSHTHGYSETVYVDRGGNMSGSHWNNRGAQTAAAGGKETRPKNVYANWIIKAKHT